MQTCFVCDFDGQKGTVLRDKPLSVSFKVDDIIAQLVETCKTKAVKEDWNARQAKYKKRQAARSLADDDLAIDSKVDVRDTNAVWGVGTIELIIEQMNREPLFVVHFDDKTSYFDEVIARNSGRLAKHGFFTSRSDIPRYA